MRVQNDILRRFALGGMLLLAPMAQAETVDEYLTSAKSHLEQQEIKAAVIQLKNAVQQAPDNVTARALLGEVYLQYGDPVSAEKELLRAIRLGGNQEQLGLFLAKAYLLQGKFAQVLNEVDLGDSASDASRAELLSIQGSAHLVQKDNANALSAFERALKYVKDHSAALLGKARLLVMEGDSEGALALVERVIAQDASNVDAWVLHGELMVQGEAVAKAKESFTKALKQNPQHVQAELGMATVLIKTNELTGAKSHIDSVLERIPFHPKAHYLSGLLALQQKELNAALEAFNQTLKVVPDHVSSTYLIGAIHYQKTEFEQAEYYLQSVVAASPTHLMARKLLASTYLKLGQAPRAIDLFKEIDTDSSDDAQLLSLLGVAHIQAGDPELGERLLEKSVELAPDMASMRAQLAIGKLASGNVGDAVDQLESAIGLDQSLVKAELMLVYIHLKARQFDQAVEAAQRLVDKHPDDPMGHNLLGLSYAGKGDRAQARTQFNQALKLDAGFNSARINLAQLALQDKEFSKAESIYQDILKRDSGNIAAMLGLAKRALANKDMEGGKRWLEKAHDADVARADVSAMLVNIHLQTGAPLKAVPVARATVEKNPDSAIAHESMGRAQMATEEYSSAVVSFQRLHELSKGHTKAALMLAGAHAKAGNVQEAEQVVREAIKKDENSPQPYLVLAGLQMSQDKTDEALATAKQVQRKFQDSSAGYALEGDICFRIEKFDCALAAFTKAYEKKKASQLAIRLYQSHAKLNQPTKAQQTLEAWLAESPKDLQARLVLAMGYQESDDTDQANRHYREILALQPENVPALNNLAWSLAEAGDKEAVAYAEKAYRLSNESPAVTDTYGWALVKAGKYDDGINVLKEGILKAPNLLDLRYHLAYAYLKRGDIDLARQESKRLERLGYSGGGKFEELKSQLQ